MNRTYTYSTVNQDRSKLYMKSTNYLPPHSGLSDNLLINLNIISKIAPKDKIYVTNEGFISIDNSTMIQGMVRFIYNNSRSKSISNLSNFYASVFSTIDAIYSSHSKCPNSQEFAHDTTGESTLLSYLRKSITGVENLKQTYGEDVVITSKLDIIIDNINMYTGKLEHVLKRLG